jgi:hypothetical protein
MIYDPNQLPNNLKNLLARLAFSPDLVWTIYSNNTIYVVPRTSNRNIMTPLGTQELLNELVFGRANIRFFRTDSIAKIRYPLQNPLFMLSLDNYGKSQESTDSS